MFGIDIETFSTAAGPSSRHHNGRRDDLGFSQSDAVNESQ